MPQYKQIHNLLSMAKWRIWGLRILRLSGALFVVFVCWKFYRVGFEYGAVAWNSARAFSFLKDWLPAVVGVMVGVVPGSEWERRMKIRYRLAIVIVGFIYSGVLYRAEGLSDKENTKQIGEAVNGAVEQANSHSDKQIGKVQTEVGDVKERVADLSQSLTTKTDRLGDLLDKATENINTSIGKVGKPDPPELAVLRPSLWKEGQSTEDEPVDVMAIQAQPDGTYTFDIAIRNTSDVAAEEADVWVNDCNSCSFASEPLGFEKITNFERHKHLGTMNPGLGQKFTFNFKVVATTSPIQRFEVGVRTTCKNCGRIGPSKMLVLTLSFPIMPPLKFPVPKGTLGKDQLGDGAESRSFDSDKR